MRDYTDRLEESERAGPGIFLDALINGLCEFTQFPVVSKDRLIQARYVAQRLDGNPHLWADMMAHRQPPNSKTDREFLRGHCNGNQFEATPGLGNTYKEVADEAGVDITGKVYLGSIAEFPGDPRAWVSGRGDVQRVCEERGWGCEGAVNVKVRMGEPKSVPLAEDIVREKVEDHLATLDPGQLAKVDVNEIAHEVTQKHKPSWSE